MTRSATALVTGFVTSVALLLSPLPAHAADPAATSKAGAYLASQATTAAAGETGPLVDVALGLLAAGDAAAAAPLVTKARDEAAAYAASAPEAAAKLAILAEAVGADPKDFGGTDLVAAVTSGVKADGAFGAYPGAWASALGLVALERVDADAPEAMVTFLLQQAGDDGGFGYASGQPSDADNTGMALVALAAAGDAPGVAEARDGALAWAEAQQADDGSWAGYNPVNSTAIMAMALDASGRDNSTAVAYLVGQQAEDGSFADQGAPNLLATAQAALPLAGVTYLDVTQAPAAPDAPAPAAAASGPGSLLWWVVGGVLLAALAWMVLKRRAVLTR